GYYARRLDAGTEHNDRGGRSLGRLAGIRRAVREAVQTGCPYRDAFLSTPPLAPRRPQAALAVPALYLKRSSVAEGYLELRPYRAEFVVSSSWPGLEAIGASSRAGKLDEPADQVRGRGRFLVR